MDVQQILRMNKGDDETSYAKNSYIQRALTLKTKPLIEAAILETLSNELNPRKFNIADLGCSSGPNALLPSNLILAAIDSCCEKLKRVLPPLEIQAFLNDLPQNDFNSIFNSIPSFHEENSRKDRVGSNLFISATPGSFYGRLFPAETLHFVYSHNCLHWISQIPPLLANETCNLNKWEIRVGQTSPDAVFEAYLVQFGKDMSSFLKSRSQEIVPGGCMVLGLLGRPVADPFAKECCFAFDNVSHILKDLVEEGVLEEKKAHSFNLPFYMPYVEELRKIIEVEGSFIINHLEAIPLSEPGVAFNKKHIAGTIRAAIEPMTKSYFGETINERLFEKLDEKEFHEFNTHGKTMVLMASVSMVKGSNGVKV